MPRYVCPLSEPRRKRRRGKNEVLQQPFPVPIASLTEIKASNAIWRWYSGRLEVAEGHVRVPDPEEGKHLFTMGFFGTREEEGRTETERKPVLKPIDPTPALKGQGQEPAGGVVATSKSDDEYDFDDEADGKEDKAKAGRKKRPHMNAELPLKLEPCEAFYLSYALSCLIVEDGDGIELDVDDLWVKFCEMKPGFAYLYRAYHHFRSKGWVVKEGYKFGVDFLLYKDGPPFYHASYSVQVQWDDGKGQGSRRKGMSWMDLAGLNRITEAAAKELMLVKVSKSTVQGDDKSGEEEDGSAEGKGEEISDDPDRGPEVLAKLNVKEVLVRRWVPSQEREEEA